MNSGYNYHLLRKAYKSFIIGKFIDKSIYDSNGLHSHVDILRNNFYLITAHFKKGAKTTNIGQQIYVMDCFRSYYMDLCTAVIDKDPRKRTILQPLVHVSFDVEGSKSHQFISNPEIPHLHGLALIHPLTKDNFDRALATGSLSKSVDGATESVKYEKIRYSKKDMNKIVAYCSKYTDILKDNNMNYSPNEFFPLLKPAKYPFYKWKPHDDLV